MDIFLFDLDGVLLNSAGYHRSLLETVRQLSLALGFGDRSLTQEEIDAFEARDITAEWDSSAVCACLLLATAWQSQDEVSLPGRLPLVPRPARHAFPDIRAFLAEVDNLGAPDALSGAEASVLRRIDSGRADQQAAIRSLLRGARSLDESVTFRLVQLFNLGSRRFEETYGEPAGLESPSFLETYDLPTLTDGERASLLGGLGQAGRAAAIVTNRPSLSPCGVFNTPEAEIGVHAAGFDGLPRVASGDLGWRATAMGLDPQAFLKPSPVHVLAGARRAAGAEASVAIESAISLVQHGVLEPAWHDFGRSRLVLFEDAPKGHTSARQAVEALGRHGVTVELVAFGIATNADKVRALAAVGARVFPHVRGALDEALPGWRRALP